MIPGPAAIATWISRNIAAFRFGVRVVVAGVVSFAIAHALGLAQGYWAVFTSVIVIQASVGASLKASIDRLIGTIGGAIYGGACAYFIPHADPLWSAIALAVALAPLGVIAALDDRFRVAPVTAVILLLVPSTTGAGPIAFTGERILEIAIGGIVAVAVSVLILPARAHGLLAEAVTRLLNRLAELMPVILGDVTKGLDTSGFFREQGTVRKALAQLDAAAEEARRERRIHLTDDPDPDPVLRTSMRVRNDLIMVSRAVAEPIPEPFATRLQPITARIAKASAALLRGIAAAFATRDLPPPLTDFEAALADYDAEVDAMRSQGLTRGLAVEAVGRLFALGFALEQFHADVRDLAERAAEFAGAPVPTAAASEAKDA